MKVLFGEFHVLVGLVAERESPGRITAAEEVEIIMRRKKRGCWIKVFIFMVFFVLLFVGVGV